MYRLLAFIIGTFALLGIVVSVEFSRYTNRSGEQSNNDVQRANDSQTITGRGQSPGEGADAVSENASGQEGYSDPAGSSAPVENSAANTGDNDLLVKNDIELLFSGDINMTDNILNKYNQDGIDGILSKDLQEEFKNADIAMVNQEFAFTNRGTPAADKQYTFRADPKNVQIFKDMQVDVVTLANNHTMDFGIDGLTDSFDILNTAGIKYVGAGHNISEAREIKYVDVKDKRIAFLGASRVIPEPDWNAYSNKAGMLTTYDPAFLLEDIKTAKTQSDFVVVYVHWGLEKQESPQEYQRNLAKQYIDVGADLVVGSHPHVLQGIEYYNGKPIIYSLGNFMFYNSINQTALLKVTLNDQGEVNVRLIPGKAENAYTYMLDNETDKSEFYQHMKRISFGIDFDNGGNVIH